MYHKLLGTKKYNVTEPLYDNALNTYIFKEVDILNVRYNYHVNKEKNNNYNNCFKAREYGELKKKTLFQKMFWMSPTFSLMKHMIKHLLKV